MPSLLKSRTLIWIGVLSIVTGDLSAEERSPKPPSPSDLGIFGIGSCHVNNRSAADYERWVPQMQSIGLKYYRALATGWGQVEPKEGEWRWKDLDEQMDYLDARGFIYGGLLHGNAPWNKLDAPSTLPVNNLAGWTRYVSTIVEHSKKRIKRWEIWNEPPNGTGKDQTPADYAKIVVASYKAAKAVDPDCLIGLAAKSVHINYLEQAIKAGAKDHFDYITLHPYEVLNGIADNAGTEAIYMNIVPGVRKMLAAQNPAKKDVPIIFTELGCDVGKGAATQAHALVKAYVMGLAQGVACIQWFEGRDGDSGPLGLLDREGKERPAYVAMKTLVQTLGQKPTYLGWVLIDEKHYGFAVRNESQDFIVAWGQPGGADEFTFPQPVTALDPLTGISQRATAFHFTPAPIILQNPPPAWIEQAKANRDQPLPWGGDYTKAKSVSLTFGDPQGVKGLHTLSGDSLAKAVVAYGGSARAGSVPGGNIFVVDPGFLSYDRTPIEITAVVRRNEVNDNAGFKLVYESTTGLRTAKEGWYTIPDNKDWHTVRWQIDDPQFVNYWGYNFSLVSDGNVFNKYYIHSVTVTKRE